jgi:putative tryptophan/tyrosine transport system substrate-binding protein
MIRRREFITLLGGAAAWPLAARAQQAQKIYRIGLLSPGSAVPTMLLGAFIEGLRQLGWIEGQTSSLSVDTTNGSNE